MPSRARQSPLPQIPSWNGHDCVATFVTPSCDDNMSNPNNYTVGWICAIKTEYVAAQEFLDEEHGAPEFISAHDSNDYTLGRIGQHNVVIAVLPDGEYGTSSAANVATHMLHSFRNVRIGLMVGIGGGVPTRHDIRLGDIVVSAPRNGESGIFQYDFGKTIQGQAFHQTGFLNQPPTALRTALTGIQAEYERKGHRLHQAVEEILNRNTRLKRGYARPKLHQDVLFRSDVVHDARGCEFCAADTSSLVSRRKRAEHEDNPAIHFGLIASGNQLMKDAKIRDRLAVEKDVLCFEMEAAGLMNHFPCLVVRGICDYSDSHKSKEWQGYAAMTAAAFAKDVLSRIQCSVLEVERTLDEVVSDLHQQATRIETEVTAMSSKAMAKDDLAMLDWLTEVNYGLQQSAYLDRRQAGTGGWLLDSDEFRDWTGNGNPTLFCPGIPGAGKTILTSMVVRAVLRKFRHRPDVSIAYIYCDFRSQEEQKFQHLLASLLRQLSQSGSSVPAEVKSLYDEHQRRGTRPSIDELTKALHLVAAAYSQVFIIVDALDELSASNRARSKFIEAILTLQSTSRANIFATSRFIPEAMQAFSGAVHLEIRAREEDIHRYLDDHMSRLPAFVARDTSLQEKIKSGITQSVQGMFLLAQLHMDSLVGKPSKRALLSALSELPTGTSAYDHAYEMAMERIEDQTEDQQRLAKRALSWLTCAIRPLSRYDLRVALSVEADESGFDANGMPDIEDIVSQCAGLVTVDVGSTIVRLVHYTTQEFFDRTQSKWLPNAQAYLRDTCIAYLSYETFPNDKFLKDVYHEQLWDQPLTRYAARFWGCHAQRAPECHEKIMRFLNSRAATRAYDYLFECLHGSLNDTGLHYAAHFGFLDATKALIRQGTDPKLADGRNRSPLYRAADAGHEDVVRHLLGIVGFEANAMYSKEKSALWVAAENSYEAIVKMLLDAGRGDIKMKHEWLRTPLFLAIKQGDEKIVNLFTSSPNFQPDLADSLNTTPLSWAVDIGDATIVKALLESRRVNVNPIDVYDRTALSCAVVKGDEVIAKLLLDIGQAEVHSLQDDYNKSPLEYAVSSGNITLVRMLLTAHLSRHHLPGRIDRALLWWSLDKGHVDIFKMLLDETRADLWDAAGIGRPLLSRAAEKGDETMVKLMLETGRFDVDAEDRLGRTALWWAERNGHTTIVDLLGPKTS